MFSRFVRTVIACAAMTLASGAGMAQSITYSGGSFAKSSLGADFPSPYDNLYYTSLPGGPVDLSSPVSADIATLTFVVGVNCWTCAQKPTFDTPVDFTVNGITQQIDLQYQWSSTGPVDMLSFLPTPGALTYDLGSAGMLNVTFSSLAALTGGVGTYSENLTANFSLTPATGAYAAPVAPVPEPSTYALLMAGLGAVGFMARRRREA